MSKLRQTVIASAAVAALALPGAAQAAGPHWQTKATFSGSKLQVCKVKVAGGWKVKGRVDGRKAKMKTYGSLIVTKKGQTTKTWQGSARAHHLGKAGSVKLPSKTGYGLEFSMGNGGAGYGGTLKITKIGRC